MAEYRNLRCNAKRKLLPSVIGRAAAKPRLRGPLDHLRQAFELIAHLAVDSIHCSVVATAGQP